MKKNWLFFAGFLIILFNNTCYTQSPNWLWVKGDGGNDTEIGNAVAIDNSGNVFVTGRFQTSVLTLGPALFYNLGEDDVYVIKYDANGNMLWARSIGGIQTDIGEAIAADAEGNVYVGGNFSSPALLFSVDDTLHNSNPGYNSIFLAKYDANGNILWYKKEGGLNTVITDLAIDDSAHLYITGALYNPSVIFGPDTLYNNSAGGESDIFIVKLDSAGNEIWATSSGASQSEYTSSISLDPFGNILVTGGFEFGYFILGNDTLTNPAIDSDDFFVVKYNNNGIPLWAKRAGAVNDADESGSSITSDQHGNVYVTGSFKSGIMYFGATPLANTDNSGNTHDIFIAKYDPNGNVLWIKKEGGSYWDYGNTIAVDDYGHVFVSGSFHSYTITFGSNTLVNTLGTNKDMYLTCYDTSGTVLWAKKAGGNDYEECVDMVIGPNGYVFLTGYYSSLTTTFDNDTLNSLPVGSGDLFTAKLNYSTIGLEELNPFGEITVFPNPTSSQIFIESNECFVNATIMLENSVGQIVRKSTKISGKQIILERDNLPPGIYFIYLKEGDKTMSKKVIVAD